jgi:pyridoxine 4-dehydrogenase
MLPIPGTASVAHLEENVLGATIRLTDEEFGAIDRGGRTGPNAADFNG